MKIKKKIEKTPLVTVCCITYNHAKFIEDALKGFLIQKTFFPYEIIIHDDASTDGTARILKSYARTYSNKIKLILQEKNRWKKKMYSGECYGYEPFVHDIFPMAKGRYLALCEGDDYWADPFKLQRQFDYMESHPECAMSYHDCVFMEDGGKIRSVGNPTTYFKGIDLVHVPVGILTASKMIKNIYNKDTKADFEKFSGDYFFTAYMGTKGDCGYVKGIAPSVYRVHSGGVWSGRTDRQKLIMVKNVNDRLYDLFLEKGNPDYIKIREGYVMKGQIFGIVIATYKRRDGSTPSLLRRALDSVFKQTYKDFVVYVIGDKYEGNQEFIDILSNYPKDKLYYENLPNALERDKYFETNKEALWCSGGVNATNYGINMAMKDGLYYICMLDHDDYWRPDHLDKLNSVILNTKADWVCSLSTYPDSVPLPAVASKQSYLEYLPVFAGLVKSSACVNFRKIPLRFRDVFAETGEFAPSDADLWSRCAEYIKSKGLKSYLSNRETCVHDLEGFSKEDLKITLVTPTGDRPETFTLTRRWMAAQKERYHQWIVVDDGVTPLPDNLREGIDYIRREPKEGEYHTINENLREALPHITGDVVLIIEDDDWYGPGYISFMRKTLANVNLAGEGFARYYLLSDRKYCRGENHSHASLSQTGFVRKLLPVFEKCLDGDPYIDIRFWKAVENKKYLLNDLEDKMKLQCSMKGLQGRKGIGQGHNVTDWSVVQRYSDDPYLTQLRHWIGEEAVLAYLGVAGNGNNGKTMVIRITETLKTSNGRMLPVGTIFREPFPSSILRRAERKKGAQFVFI